MFRLEYVASLVDDMTKAKLEKKSVIEMPVSFDVGSSSKKGGTMDEDFVVESLEKLRDYLMGEIKKINDQFFKFKIDFDTKMGEKIDRKELEAIESKG